MNFYKWLGEPFKGKRVNGMKTPEVTQTKRVTVYKVERVWDKKRATHVYGLYSATEVHFSDGRKSIFTDPFSPSDKDGWWLTQTGNKAWAERTKKHYMPLSGKEDVGN